MDKNISVWRGDSTPPTSNHIWIKPNNIIYLFKDGSWLIIAGQRLVKQLSDLYKLSDAILSESKIGEDAEGLIWIVGKDLYQLISWQNRNNASGWLKVIPFNEKMFDRFYNLDGNMINSLTGYTKATELLNLLENDSLLNALGKLEYKSDLTYDLVTSVYEGVHTIEELREMLKILEGIQNSSEVLNSYLSKYLPLTGGIMNGSIDMNKNPLKNAGFEVVTTLPTTNLFVGRQVTYEGKLYTYNNNEWNCIADDLGGKPETHEENFVYQPTAADLSIKDGFADIKKLKGNTIVWNQLFRPNYYIMSNNNGINFAYNNGAIIVNGITTSGLANSHQVDNLNLIKGHKILVQIKGNIDVGFNIYSYSPQTINTGVLAVKNSTIYTCLNSGIANARLRVDKDLTIENEVVYLNIFDLTQMFGEGNEPATIEEFEAIFPNDYYEYNKGELMSFDGKGVKSVGFNSFDGEQAKVLKGQKYYLGGTYTALGFKENENSEAVAFELSSDRYYTPTSNGYIVATGENICINLSHSGYRNGDYEPYEDYKISFQDGKTISQLTGKLNGEGDSVVIFPDGLRSAGTAYDEITYDETTGNHKSIKRIGSVDMGTLNWVYDNSGTSFNFYAYVSAYGFVENSNGNTKANIVSAIYNTSPTFGSGNSINKTIKLYQNYILRILDTSYTDAASLKASLQGQILYYELAEPEIYDLDFPINTSYEAYDFGTEEVLYNDDKEVNIPMKANIEYGFNAVDMIRSNYFDIQKLKKKIDELTVLIESLLTTQSINYEKIEN